MLPVILPAAASFVGGMMANASRERVADKQMEFQERMSSTAHQREVQDLMAAGLNPMLSARLGGASSPGGAMPQVEDVVSPAVASAQQGRMVKAQVDNMEAQTENTKMRTMMDGQVLRAQAELLGAQRQQTLSSAGATEAQGQLFGAQIPKTVAELKEVVERTLNYAPQRGLYDAQTKAAIQAAARDMTQADLNEVQEKLQRYQLNEAKAGSEFYGGVVGEASPMARFLLQILSTLKK